MNLERVAEKLSGVAKRIKAGKGPLELFGLFLREESPDLWDLVIAAPWLPADEFASFEYVADQLRQALTDEERAELSRIVILDPDGAVVKAFLETFGNRTGLADVHFVSEGGAIIRRVYILVTKPGANGTSHQSSKKPRRSKIGSQKSQSPGNHPL